MPSIFTVVLGLKSLGINLVLVKYVLSYFPSIILYNFLCFQLLQRQKQRLLGLSICQLCGIECILKKYFQNLPLTSNTTHLVSQIVQNYLLSSFSGWPIEPISGNGKWAFVCVFYFFVCFNILFLFISLKKFFLLFK